QAPPAGHGCGAGATKSNFSNISGGQYDYGPGANLNLRVNVRRRGHSIIGLEPLSYWIRSVNGAGTSPTATLNRVQVDVPVRSFFATGAEVLVFTSDRHYADLPDV